MSDVSCKEDVAGFRLTITCEIGCFREVWVVEVYYLFGSEIVAVTGGEDDTCLVWAAGFRRGLKEREDSLCEDEVADDVCSLELEVISWVTTHCNSYPWAVLLSLGGVMTPLPG
jgi:hypothetical protein